MVYLILLAFALLFVIGVPIAFALGIAGSLYIVVVDGLPGEILVRRIFYALNSFPLLAIPLFILMAHLSERAGLIPRLVKWLLLLVGRLRGGMAYINVIASFLMAGVSGTAVSDVAELGRIEISMMRKAGYSLEFSAALTAATSVIGPVIPPSVAMVIYALAAGNISIGGLFLAGVIPGIMMAVLLFTLCRWKSGQETQRHSDRPPLAIFARETVRVLPLLALPLIILGGIISGIFTVTESAAVGVVYILAIGFLVTRELRVKDMVKGLVYAAETSAVLGMLMGTGAIVSWILTRNQAAAQLVEFVSAFGGADPVIFLAVTAATLLLLGLIMDATAVIIALAPLLAPVTVSLGIPPFQFATIFILTVMIGMITPPVGILLFVTSAVSGVRYERLAKAIVPFIILEVLVVLALITVPALTQWLPNAFGF